MTLPISPESRALWGPLADRYLGDPRPRKLLALDGGGIRGLMTLRVLARMEKQLANGDAQFRLCDYFDYVAGTSTGAIIAAAIARGLSVAEILAFYEGFAEVIFTKRPLFERWGALYQNGPLAKQLREVYGETTTLSPSDLRCLLLVVTRNVTTDSPWPLSSNPAAKYNDPARVDSNLRVPLWQLVRASTAAPVFFPPEHVRLSERTSFVFVDGGTTAYNNPAWLLARFATAPAYKLEWPTGEEKLLLVSVGTGSAPDLGPTSDDGDPGLVDNVTTTLSAVMYHSQVEQDLSCRTFGRCVFGGAIDREVGDMVAGAGDRAFRYVRYDADLSPEGLIRLGSTADPARITKLDCLDQLAHLADIGDRVASHVDVAAHFGPFVTAG